MSTKRGRPKGSLNQVTNEAKRAILMAFDQLGGVQRLVDWVKADPANEALYWTRIFAKLLPRPAADVAAPVEALPPIRGALTWKTPDWAKQAQREASRPGPGRAASGSGVTATTSAIAAAASERASGPLDGGPPPPGWVAPC